MGLTITELGEFDRGLVADLKVAFDAREGYLDYIRERAMKGA